MGVSEPKRGRSRCLSSSTTFKILRSGLATRENGITCTNYAQPVGALVQPREAIGCRTYEAHQQRTTLLLPGGWRNIRIALIDH